MSEERAETQMRAMVSAAAAQPLPPEMTETVDVDADALADYLGDIDGVLRAGDAATLLGLAARLALGAVAAYEVVAAEPIGADRFAHSTRVVVEDLLSRRAATRASAKGTRDSIDDLDLDGLRVLPDDLRRIGDEGRDRTHSIFGAILAEYAAVVLDHLVAAEAPIERFLEAEAAVDRALNLLERFPLEAHPAGAELATDPGDAAYHLFVHLQDDPESGSSWFPGEEMSAAEWRWCRTALSAGALATMPLLGTDAGDWAAFWRRVKTVATGRVASLDLVQSPAALDVREAGRYAERQALEVVTRWLSATLCDRRTDANEAGAWRTDNDVSNLVEVAAVALVGLVAVASANT